jgi:hypothetical protein
MSELLKNIKPERPEPILLKHKPFSVNKKTNRRTVVEKLLSGKYALVEDKFPTGLAVLSDLKKTVFGKKSKEDFKAYRETRTEYHHASNNLLVSIRNNKIALPKAPETGWLEMLYADISDFYLSFPQVQGLNSAWQWYIKGIKYPGLKKKLHPWYGTYFPTRFDHLISFDKWLKSYSGRKSTAIDIGTGCGVLAFQLLNRGFEKVIAADINPNAVISVMENAEKPGLAGRLDVRQSDLFEHCEEKADLIVFNPPWLPAQQDVSGLDSAIYYEPGLFERFFGQAVSHLNEDGTLILLFSNLARTAGVGDTHPVEEELEKNNRFRKVRLIKRKVSKPSRKTKRRDHRKDEFVELWELAGQTD